MKKTNMELIVGGFILIALFILIAGVMWLKSSTLTRSMVEYSVLFPNIGSLQQGDPVQVNGVRKGVVGPIALNGARVTVVIKVDKDVKITDSSTITVQNIGLMGERTVGIQLSEKGNIIRPSARGKITYIKGNFDSGIAEAMGMLGSVLGDARVLLANVSAIVDSTVGDSAFFAAFRHIVGRLDTVSRLAQTLVRDNKGKIDASISNVKAVTSDMRELLDSNRAQINTIVANGTALSSRAVAIVSTVDTITASLQAMVKKIERGEGSLGALVSDEQFYKDLKKAVADLDALVSDVQQDGLKL
ncbi:MAG TPA: MlaD family protein, partial [Chitinivibrionales bacterium]|nr:MlaD family protein [Chitinivibrionales bacterium]